MEGQVRVSVCACHVSFHFVNVDHSKDDKT